MRSGHWVGLGLLATGLLAAASVAVPADHAELLPDDPIKPALVATCTACHDATEITTANRKTQAQWDFTINKMEGLGAEIKADERPAILAYLTANFSPSPTAAPEAPTITPATPAAP